MRDVLAAYFEEVNARGGVYNRKLTLKSAGSGAGAAETAASARALIEREQVFALVGGVAAGAERELAALAAERETPFVGPATLMPASGLPINRQVFYLMPGVAEQARALANFAAGRAELKGAAAAVVSAEGELNAAAARAAEEQLKLSGLPAAAQTYARGAFDAAAAVRQLKQKGAGAVFFFGASGDEAAFLKAAAAADYAPHVFLLGVLAGPDTAAALTPAFKDKIFLSFPSVPSDVKPEAVAEFRALQAKYKIAPGHTASQLAAFAAARTFVEALKRAGQDLTRERLLAALESLYDFETGVTPRLSFGPNRRVGAAGAYVVTIDPAKKEFAPVGGWINAFKN
jgi:ABC-type branched-subunit amino acid transport system substrate-binding protein